MLYKIRAAVWVFIKLKKIIDLAGCHNVALGKLWTIHHREEGWRVSNPHLDENPWLT
jgi:hypothetical protein